MISGFWFLEMQILLLKTDLLYKMAVEYLNEIKTSCLKRIFELRESWSFYCGLLLNQ